MSNLTCQGQVNTYTITVTANCTSCQQTLKHSVSITVNVQAQGADFTININPNIVNVTTNKPGTATITITPKNNFNQTLKISVNGAPQVNINCKVNPSNVTTSKGNVNATLSCTGQYGTYTVTVSANSPTLTTQQHFATVVYNVGNALRPGFSLMTSQTNLDCSQGETVTVNIQVVNRKSFTGTVKLTAESLPSGAFTTTLSPSTITNGSGSTTLTVKCNTATSGNISIRATSDYRVASIVIPVQVKSK
jgi:uncharacterized membrane protein